MRKLLSMISKKANNGILIKTSGKRKKEKNDLAELNVRVEPSSSNPKKISLCMDLFLQLRTIFRFFSLTNLQLY